MAKRFLNSNLFLIALLLWLLLTGYDLFRWHIVAMQYAVGRVISKMNESRNELAIASFGDVFHLQKGAIRTPIKKNSPSLLSAKILVLPAWYQI